MNEYSAIGPAGSQVARAHDPNGNRTDDGTRGLVWDAFNRLVLVVRNSDAAPIAAYFYLPDGRRSRKVVYSQTTPGVVEREVRFVWDGAQEVEEQSAAGATLGTFVWSPVYVDELVEWRREAAHPLGAGSFFAHQDARCDVVAVSNAAGQVVEKRRYDDFGREEVRDAGGGVVAGSPSGLEYGFQGRRRDQETGWLYFRARYYSAEEGRFLSRDPVWDAANVGGWYTFVGNGPVSWSDPGGQQGRPIRGEGPGYSDTSPVTVTGDPSGRSVGSHRPGWEQIKREGGQVAEFFTPTHEEAGIGLLVLAEPTPVGEFGWLLGYTGRRIGRVASWVIRRADDCPSTAADAAEVVVEKGAETFRFKRFADRSDPSTLLPRGSDTPSLERAAEHMRGRTEGSPFVSGTESVEAAAETGDFSLQTIIHGEYGGSGLPWPGKQRAPDIGTFEVPRSRVLRACEVPGAPETAIQEQEVLFMGEDLHHFLVRWERNPFGQAEP